MPEPTPISITTRAGVRRDGTRMDADFHAEAQWVRFQRGRPRKIGGYREVSADLVGPVSGVQVWSRAGTYIVVAGSPYGIEQISVGETGVGAALADRTPVGMTVDERRRWQFDVMFDAAAGSNKSLIIAHASMTADDVDDPTDTPIYTGPANTNEAFTSTGTNVSGGIVVLHPYLVGFGSDGLVIWSNANEPRNFTTGDAGTARITPFKIVKGMPVRSGGVPAGLLWSLDSLIKMIFVGGSQIFSFDPVTSRTSILSPSSVIEFDGVFFWIGVDRFLYYDGAVRELPNDMNINWFFDNLNWAGRNLVWAMKFPRWGEIWWFYPRGDATECSHAIIYNVREKTWYDLELPRSAGYTAQVWRYPLMVGEHLHGNDTSGFTMTGIVGVFQHGEEVTGSLSSAVGRIVRIMDIGVGNLRLNVEPILGTFSDTDVVTGSTSGATGTIAGAPVTQQLTDVWLHDFGFDRVTSEGPVSIHAWYESHDMGLPTGSPVQEQPMGTNRWTRIVRMEPDFVQQGEMVFKVVGKPYAQAPETTSDPGYPFDPDTEVVDLREQHREFRLRFESDTLGGDFQAGRVLVHVAPGDGRV